MYVSGTFSFSSFRVSLDQSQCTKFVYNYHSAKLPLILLHGSTILRYKSKHKHSDLCRNSSHLHGLIVSNKEKFLFKNISDKILITQKKTLAAKGLNVMKLIF